MDLKEINLLALMPCPTKVPLERFVSEKVRELSKGDEPMKYKIFSNAVMQGDIFQDIANADSLEELPDIMLAPGFSRFFYPSFVEKFRNTGGFESSCNFTPSSAYELEQICDPDGYYDIIAFNPLVLLYDKTVHKNLPEPECYDDLLKDEYEDLVAYRGHDSKSICEGVLFTVYKKYGHDGIKRLARSIKCRLHPSQMVKLAGSGKAEAPAVSVIPLSFAQTVKLNKNVKIIWPSDGAIVNPLVMLAKKSCSDRVKELAKFLVGDTASEIFQEIGFYSIRPNLEHLIPRSGKYQFVGWDFLKTNDLGTLLAELNDIVNAENETRRNAKCSL